MLQIWCAALNVGSIPVSCSMNHGSGPETWVTYV